MPSWQLADYWRRRGGTSGEWRVEDGGGIEHCCIPVSHGVTLNLKRGEIYKGMDGMVEISSEHSESFD